jgi:hypothetical protein
MSDMRNKKESLFFMLLLGCVFVSVYAGEKVQKYNLQGYEIRKINKADYNYGKNWDEFIGPDTSFFIAYKMDEEMSCKYITDIIYFLRYKSGKEIFLGRISKEFGFQNALGNQFISDKELEPNSEYMTEDVVGFSLDSVKYPFYIEGMAKDKKTGEIYQTEVFARLEVDSKKLSLIEYRSIY